MDGAGGGAVFGLGGGGDSTLFRRVGKNPIGLQCSVRIGVMWRCRDVQVWLPVRCGHHQRQPDRTWGRAL